jgi:polycystin 1L2
MISNAMFYGQDEAVERLKIGPIKFALSSIYISFIGVIMTFPVILAITMIFRKSNSSESITDRDEMNIESFQTQKDEKEFRLPKKLIYVAYLLIAVSILVSGFFVVLYSMEWGKSKSEEWLKTFFLSFLESMFVVDPIKVCINGFCFCSDVSLAFSTLVVFSQDFFSFVGTGVGCVLLHYNEASLE